MKIIKLLAKTLIFIPIVLIFLYFKPGVIGKWIVEDEFIRRLGTILPALIAVASLYATVANNRRGKLFKKAWEKIFLKADAFLFSL